MYKYFPNNFAIAKFELMEKEYQGRFLTQLLENTLGRENFARFVSKQEPLFVEKKLLAEVRIILNPDEPDCQKFKFLSIGTVEKFLQLS